MRAAGRLPGGTAADPDRGCARSWQFTDAKTRI